MKKIIALGKFTLGILALAFLSGCLVVESPLQPGVVRTQVQDGTPFMVAPLALCYRDPYYQDYIWEFEVWSEEASQVWVDVYDDWGFVESFPLFRERGQFWSSWWIEYETNLWCGDYYSFDFIAVDRWGNSEIVTRQH